MFSLSWRRLALPLKLGVQAVEWCESNILLEQGILSPSVDAHTRPRLKSTVLLY